MLSVYIGHRQDSNMHCFFSMLAAGYIGPTSLLDFAKRMDRVCMIVNINIIFVTPRQAQPASVHQWTFLTPPQTEPADTLAFASGLRIPLRVPRLSVTAFPCTLLALLST